MSHSDTNFFKVFAVVLGILVLFTFAVIILANIIAPEREPSDLKLRQLSERLAPIGQVVTDAADLPVVTNNTTTPAPTVALKSGQEVIDAACVACHASGVANAPKLDDAAEWEKRLGAVGLDGLINAVIQGKGAMPPRGGSQFSDEELAAAVKAMVGQ